MSKTNHIRQWTKAGLRWLMLVIVLTGVTSCQMRDVLGPDDQAHIRIDVDWSLMDEKPTGMTVIFYPTDGSAPYSYVTNNVDRIERDLPEKDYDILVFNQSIEEFSTIRFRGMDRLETAETYAPPSDDDRSRLDRLYNKRKGGGSRGFNANARIKPKCLGSTSATTSGNSKPTRGFNANARIKPKPGVGNLSATVHVAGLSNAIAVNGAITGMASGAFLMADGPVSAEPMTQELDNWSIRTNSDGSIGTIHTEIGTFGLSPTVDNNATSRTDSDTKSTSGTSYIESTEEDDYRNILYLNFLLQDRTYVSFRFDVTNAIQDYTTDVEVELILDLGTDIQEYLELPDTGFPYETPAISVEAWGEEVNHYPTLQ